MQEDSVIEQLACEVLVRCCAELQQGNGHQPESIAVVLPAVLSEPAEGLLPVELTIHSISPIGMRYTALVNQHVIHK